MYMYCVPCYVCIVMQAHLCMYNSCIIFVSLSHSIIQNLALHEINNNHALWSDDKITIKFYEIYVCL